jgi:hypothetical protein
MRTSGQGSDALTALMTLVPLGVLVLFAMYMAGGPRELLEVANSTVRWALEGVRSWLATR